MAHGVLGFKGTKKEAPPRNKFVDQVVVLFATCGYVGYTPGFPGTAGAAFGVFCYYAILLKLKLHPLMLFFVFLSVFIFGGFICTLAHDAMTEADHNLIVIDKALGAAIAVSTFQLNVWNDAFPRILFVFMIFRVWEIVKIFPLGPLSKIHKGWGMMADDVAGGIIALAIVHFAVPESFWNYVGWTLPNPKASPSPAAPLN